MRSSTVALAHLVLAAGLLLLHLGCASKHATNLEPTGRIGFIPDVTDEEWAAAKVFDKATMRAPRLLAGKHELKAVGVSSGQIGYAKVATVIRKDGSLGVYRILTTNNATFAAAVAALLRRNRYEQPVFDGEPIALRVEWEYRATRD